MSTARKEKSWRTSRRKFLPMSGSVVRPNPRLSISRLDRVFTGFDLIAKDITFHGVNLSIHPGRPVHFLCRQRCRYELGAETCEKPCLGFVRKYRPPTRVVENFETRSVLEYESFSSCVLGGLSCDSGSTITLLSEEKLPH